MGLEVQLNEIVASELEYVPTEQFMLGKVVRTHYINQEERRDWMGEWKKGDHAFDVLKYEPVSVGSSHYILTDKVISVFTDDIRVRSVELSDVAIRRSRRGVINSVVTRRTDDQFVLEADKKMKILSKLSDNFE